jgi:DNA-binding CsgD family transcriptional regulator
MLRKSGNGRWIRIVPGKGLSQQTTRTLWSNLYCKAGIQDDFVLRALICDGPLLLAWVGMFQSAPPSQDQGRVLSSLLPSLLKRLKVERALGPSGLNWAALNTVLERISRPAFLLKSAGGIVHANFAGQALAGSDLARLHEQLQSSLRGADSGFEITRLACTGVSQLYLVVQRQAEALDASLLERAADAFHLTARETAVLSKLVNGESNQRIGTALGCSESNVERYVTRLYRKARVENRRALIAGFWGGRHP